MANAMTFRFEGVPEFEAALTAKVAEMNAAARGAVTSGVHLIELRTKENLARTSHQRGTPTPAAPGQPPSLIDGTLRRSVKVKGPSREGADGWKAEIGPTAVYGRIQELGGMTGRGHRTRLPARPYLGPALDQVVSSGELEAAMREGWFLGGVA